MEEVDQAATEVVCVDQAYIDYVAVAHSVVGSTWSQAG